MFLKGVHEKWKLFAPVPDQDFQDLNKKFKKARDGVNKLLEEVEIHNRKQKETVIAEVEALDKEDIDASVARIRLSLIHI